MAPHGTRSFSISEILPLVEPDQVVEDPGLAMHSQDGLWNSTNNVNQQNVYQQNFQNRNIQSGGEVGSKRKNAARNTHTDPAMQQMFGSAEIDFEPVSYSLSRCLDLIGMFLQDFGAMFTTGSSDPNDIKSILQSQTVRCLTT